jgi:hypothetical protein
MVCPDMRNSGLGGAGAGLGVFSTQEPFPGPDGADSDGPHPADAMETGWAPHRHRAGDSDPDGGRGGEMDQNPAWGPAGI